MDVHLLRRQCIDARELRDRGVAEPKGAGRTDGVAGFHDPRDEQMSSMRLSEYKNVET